jgi:3-deoxy-D-manno-octulosonic-acid transferase
MPIIFGPVHTKFREALELIEVGGAFPINSREDFEERIAALIASPDLLADTGKKIQNYVVKNLGATQIIFDKIFSR